LTIDEVIVHTGQHYDYAMSQSFFEEMDLPVPAYHLDIGSGSHGDQTGRMLAAIEKVLVEEKPDAVLLYGDTNSTIAGALAAAKLHIPIGHVEGGMRSFNRKMPEEVNRVIVDHVATWHFCPTETAVSNLSKEGVVDGVHLVGDVMHDAVMCYQDIASERSKILDDLGLSQANDYALCTIHRPENTDSYDRLSSILEAIVEISKDMSAVIPLHPRTGKAIEECGLTSLISKNDSLMVIDPVTYIDMIQLEQNAKVILTDSGGMQKEAFWLGVPCVTMRDETEWVETVEAGVNRVVGANYDRIVTACAECRVFDVVDVKSAYASNSIIEILSQWGES